LAVTLSAVFLIVHTGFARKPLNERYVADPAWTMIQSGAV
jgi:hypothetical protein